MADKTEWEAALETALQIAGSQMADGADGIPYVVVPEGYRVEDMEHLLPRPRQRKASVQFSSPASFCEYVKAYGGPIGLSDTVLFANDEAHSITAVLDYHGAGAEGKAAWLRHRATLQLTHSPEWSRWTGKNRSSFTQIGFAEFLEDNLKDIVEPEAATVLEAAQHLEEQRTVKFKSGVNLHDGTAQLLYDESAESKGKGAVKIPTRFTLGLRPFTHGSLYAVQARLRYSVKDGCLTFVYILDRPEDVLEAAFVEVLASVEKETSIVPLLGKLL